MEQFDGNWLRRFRRNLRSWYAKHARDLPWRKTADPYAVWISEIMLQQTTVAAVIPYFERFVTRFPTVHTLAAASEEDVLRFWEGLGYYSRARNIHKTAGQIVDRYGGQFPDTVDQLVGLPGIGRYTAGAIASFAFGQRAPIVEANTLRLYCRLMGFQGDPRSSAGQRLLWQFAQHVLPRKDVGRFNQALMELGGTVCSVTEPGCSVCPVRSCCQAFRDGMQAEIPCLAPRVSVTAVLEASVAVCDRKGNYLLRRRAEGERWAGLWDFPRFPIGDSAAAESLARRGSKQRAVPQELKEQMEKTLAASYGLHTELTELLTTIQHSVTRYRITLFCFHARCASQTSAAAGETRWVRPDQFDDYPLSVTGRKLARLLVLRQV